MGARPTPLQSRASDVLAFGPVHLEVTDVHRSGAFWQEVVGLRPVPWDAGGTALGAGERPLVVLHPGARGARPPGRSGLYHLALHVPSEADFADAIARASVRRWPQAPTDHITHWATYLDDPDGIQVEVAFETPDRVGTYEAGPGWPRIVDADGRARRAVEPLDTADVMHHATAGGQERPMADGTVVGHLHLHVRDLDEAQAFHADLMGMTRNVAAPAIGFADLSLGGPFPHRMAVNTWQAPGAPPAAGAPGMRHADLLWRDAAARDAALARLHDAGALRGDSGDPTPTALDPSGNAFRLGTP